MSARSRGAGLRTAGMRFGDCAISGFAIEILSRAQLFKSPDRSGAIPLVSHDLQANRCGDDTNDLLLIVHEDQPVAVFRMQTKCAALDFFPPDRNLLFVFEIYRDR